MTAAGGLGSGDDVGFAVAAVCRDGLRGFAGAAGDAPELEKAEVVKCENGLVDIVLGVAEYACGLADGPAEPLRSNLRTTVAEV